jgi:hypothetical protein
MKRFIYFTIAVSIILASCSKEKSYTETELNGVKIIENKDRELILILNSS